jgi:hypothetical protein
MQGSLSRRLKASALIAGTAFFGGALSLAQASHAQTVDAGATPGAVAAAEGPQEGPQSAGPQSAPANDVIIVTGTRTEGRSVQDSPVPVDVLTAEAI